jgi:hypothetical protein
MMLADIDYAAIPRPLSALPFLVSSRRPQLLDRKEKAVCIAIDSRGSVAGKALTHLRSDFQPAGGSVCLFR